MSLAIMLIILLIVSVVAILMASVVLGLIVTGGVPFISSNRKDFDAILKAADLKTGETIYDLGCGKAHLLIKAAKDYGAKGVGYEITLWPYLWAKIKIFLAKVDVRVEMKDFFKVDLSQADVVYCYLFPKVMLKLEEKFKKELKSGSRVVAYGFKLPNLKPTTIIATNSDNVELGKIFVYTF
ncbi:MAG TPA: SAM-dependent methyltransferase [Patescibacteria group bacterium]|nr:SAM-dependent methyltransferase [Patescibacteria group bacterium]